MDLRTKIKEAGLYQWQVASVVGICESTLLRWLRNPTSEQEKKIVAAIESLKKQGIGV